MIEQFINEIAAHDNFPVYIKVKIIPGAQNDRIMGKLEDNCWKIAIKAPPEKGKANEALIKFLKKNCGIVAELISGSTSRIKLLKITNAPNITK